MKKGWQKRIIDDICVFRGGGTPSKSKERYWKGDIPWVSPKDMKFDVITDSIDHVSAEAIEQSTTNLIPTGSILVVVRSGILARTIPVAITGRDVTINQDIKALCPYSSVDAWFLFYFLKSRLEEMLLLASRGATVHRIMADQIRAMEIPVPPLLEQQRIVGLLDEAFEGIANAKANAEKNRQNARALFESHLQSVFTQRGPGWVEKPLGDLCDFLNGFAFKSGDVVAESQTQLVRMGNLYGNQLDLDRSPVFYPDSFATEHSRYVLEEGDIIMSLTGTTGKEDYGFAVRIPDCGHNLLMNQRIMKFDALRRDIIDDGYLLHYLRSRCFLDILYPTANGTRQANLSSVTMKLLPVLLGSLKEQKAIATKLDSLHEETQRLARLYERKIAALEALKKSLLHQAFTGEL